MVVFAAQFDRLQLVGPELGARGQRALALHGGRPARAQRRGPRRACADAFRHRFDLLAYKCHMGQSLLTSKRLAIHGTPADIALDNIG